MEWLNAHIKRSSHPETVTGIDSLIAPSIESNKVDGSIFDRLSWGSIAVAVHSFVFYLLSVYIWTLP